MTDHPSHDKLVAWVTGTLTHSDAQALEAHVNACEACTERLAAEARVEQDLHALAELSLPSAASPAPANTRRWWLAVAAAAAVVLASVGISQRTTEPSPVVQAEAIDITPVCILTSDPECVSDADRRGLFVPGRSVPNYAPSNAHLGMEL